MISFVVRRRVVGPNQREHHFARKRRVSSERAGVSMGLLIHHGPDWKRRLAGPPYVVTLTRLGPRELDSDNLQGACKAIRDQVALELGLDDSPRSPIEWVYRQERGEYGVRVEIRSLLERVG